MAIDSAGRLWGCIYAKVWLRPPDQQCSCQLSHGISSSSEGPGAATDGAAATTAAAAAVVAAAAAAVALGTLAAAAVPPPPPMGHWWGAGDRADTMDCEERAHPVGRESERALSLPPPPPSRGVAAGRPRLPSNSLPPPAHLLRRLCGLRRAEELRGSCGALEGRLFDEARRHRHGTDVQH